jgi:hypothetical protein
VHAPAAAHPFLSTRSKRKGGDHENNQLGYRFGFVMIFWRNHSRKKLKKRDRVSNIKLGQMRNLVNERDVTEQQSFASAALVPAA